MHLLEYYLQKKSEVKWSRYRPAVAQRVGRGIALLFHDRGTRRGEWSAARPGRTLHPGRTRYPFYRRLGGPQGRPGRAENLVPNGIRSQTVQPVVSHYTDWATRPTDITYTCSKLLDRVKYKFIFLLVVDLFVELVKWLFDLTRSPSS